MKIFLDWFATALIEGSSDIPFESHQLIINNESHMKMLKEHPDWWTLCIKLSSFSKKKITFKSVKFIGNHKCLKKSQISSVGTLISKKNIDSHYKKKISLMIIIVSFTVCNGGWERNDVMERWKQILWLMMWNEERKKMRSYSWWVHN